MNTKRLFALCLCFTGLLSSLTAQSMPAANSVPGVDPLFLKLFAAQDGFCADTSITVLETPRNATTSLESRYEFSKGSLRVDLDLTKMKSPDMTEEAASQLQAMGMGQMITLTRPDRGLTYAIYPGLKACVQMPIAEAKVAEKADGSGAQESVALGSEDLDGHHCAKKKIVFTMADGKKRELVAWLAADMKDFPIQLCVTEDNNAVIIRFKNVKLEPPAPSRLDVPAGYTTYGSIQEMMQNEVLKKMSGLQSE